MTELTTPPEEVMLAYSDAGPQRQDERYTRSDRCLNFILSGWVHADRARQLVTLIGDYNRFNPKRAMEAIGMTAFRDESARFLVGREGSPSLYIDTANPSRIVESMKSRQFMADEVAVVSADQIGGLSHIMCEHTDAHAAYYAEPETDADREYVRMWWD